VAFYMSQSLSLGLVLESLMDPLGSFGEFLTAMIPVQSVTATLRFYFKLPLSGLATFIVQFGINIEIDCGILNAIKTLIQGTEDTLNVQIWNQLPGSSEIDSFCSSPNRNLSAEMSIGFEGVNLLRKQSYIEFGAGSSKKRIDFDIFPSCPPPVFTGGSCSENDDCRSGVTMKNGVAVPKNDPEGSSCSAYQGYCLNHPDWKSSIGCSGTCIEKLDVGEDCSKRRVNIHALDPTHALSSGDGNACKSGKCICGKCAGSASSYAASKDGNYMTIASAGVPNNHMCSENSDCQSGWCEGMATAGCSGRCKPKRQPGQKCFGGYDASCTTNKCSGLVECNVCQYNNGKIPNNGVCQKNSQCHSGWCEGGNIGCGGRCRSKRADGHKCYGSDDNSCASGKCRGCDYCANSHGQLPENYNCRTDSNCRSGFYCHGGAGHWGSCRSGTCRRKISDGHRHGGSNASCRSGRRNCDICGRGNVPKGGKCSEDSDCQRRDCTACWGCPKWGCRGRCKH